MMPQQKRQRERPKSYRQPFMIILVLLAVAVCGVHQKAYLESKGKTSGYVIDLSYVPESGNGVSNKIIESRSLQEQALDSLKVLSKNDKKIVHAGSVR
jgi:hypothetical protein